MNTGVSFSLTHSGISKEIRLLAKEDNVEIHNLGNLQKFLKKYSLSRADIFKRLEKGRLRI